MTPATLDTIPEPTEADRELDISYRRYQFVADFAEEYGDLYSVPGSTAASLIRLLASARRRIAELETAAQTMLDYGYPVPTPEEYRTNMGEKVERLRALLPSAPPTTEDRTDAR